MLSTGRSGSTTILQMLNAVPFIELAGELTNTNTQPRRCDRDELKRSRVVRSVTAVIMVGMIIITRAGPDRRPMPRSKVRLSRVGEGGGGRGASRLPSAVARAAKLPVCAGLPYRRSVLSA